MFGGLLSGTDFVAMLLSELKYCLHTDAYLSKYDIVLKERNGKGKD